MPLTASKSFAFTTAAPPKPAPAVKILAGSPGTLSAYLPASVYLSTTNVAAFLLYQLTQNEFLAQRFSTGQNPPLPGDGALLRTLTAPIPDDAATTNI